jgi:hypothetical protein
MRSIHIESSCSGRSDGSSSGFRLPYRAQARRRAVLVPVLSRATDARDTDDCSQGPTTLVRHHSNASSGHLGRPAEAAQWGRTFTASQHVQRARAPARPRRPARSGARDSAPSLCVIIACHSRFRLWPIVAGTTGHIRATARSSQLNSPKRSKGGSAARPALRPASMLRLPVEATPLVEATPAASATGRVALAQGSRWPSSASSRARHAPAPGP